ncbi:hypothetical protein GCM10009827_095930 [Dactylosporangium maewongense]|uniref:Uncharacterized protein n=1 Tax=Dactylosporangium maewongense TaxID=634393 RepID=A0ABN2CL78_9ACTN
MARRPAQQGEAPGSAVAAAAEASGFVRQSFGEWETVHRLRRHVNDGADATGPRDGSPALAREGRLERCARHGGQATAPLGDGRAGSGEPRHAVTSACGDLGMR